MRRRWYVVVATLLVAGLAFVLFARDGGTYTTKTVVTFLVPTATSLSPNNGSTDSSVIAFARAVAAGVNSGRQPVSYSTDDAPYFGAGLREGVLVVVPNAGNQWYQSYTRAEIDIQIVGRTKAWVAEQQTQYVREVLATAQTQQEVLGLKPADRITASVVPLTLDIGEATPTRSAQLAAIAALLLAAAVISAWGAVALDRRLQRPTPTPSPSPVVSRRPRPLSLRGSTT